MIFGETLRFFPQKVQKVLKWPLQYVNFQKFSGKACPWIPLEHFSFSIYFKMIVPEKKKHAWKYGKLGCPILEKISWIRCKHENIFKGLFTPFLGLTSLCLINTPPNSKLYPLPTKIFWPHSWVRHRVFFRTHPPLKFPGCAPVHDCWLACICMHDWFWENQLICILPLMKTRYFQSATPFPNFQMQALKMFALAVLQITFSQLKTYR